MDKIEFVGGGNVVSAPIAERESTTITTRLGSLTNDVLALIIDDTASLGQIRENQLIEAKLFLRVKSKPRDMAREEFQRVMSAITTNVTNESGIILRTKDGNKYTGEAVKVKKEVEVERTTGGRIVEEQLKQKMEVFLTELRDIEDHG